MQDKKLPPSAFIVIGVGAMLMSIFINYEKLAFFILVGAILIVYGFLRILTMEKKKTKEHIERQNAHHETAHESQYHGPAQHKPQHQHTANKSHHAQHKESHVQHHPPDVRCSGCGVKLHPRFKYCPNCGHQLR